MEEKAVTGVEFDLPPGKEKRKLRGKASFFPDRIVAECDGKASVIKTDGITSYKQRHGVGCIMLEAQTKDGDILICRATVPYSDVFSAAVKTLNRRLSLKDKDGKDEKTEEDNECEKAEIGKAKEDAAIVRICEKCGRALPNGSVRCPFCMKKGGFLKRLWAMGKPVRPYIYLSAVLYFAVAGIGLLLPYLNRILVDDYIVGTTSPRWSGYISAVVMILFANLAKIVLGVFRSSFQTVAGSKIIVRLRRNTFEAIEKMSLGRISKRTAGELMNRVTEDTGKIERFIVRDMGNAIEQLLTLAAVCVIVFMYDPGLAALVLLPAPAVMLSHRLMWKYLGKRYGRQWYLGAKASSVLNDIFSGIRVVKSFGTEKAEEKKYDSVISDERKTRADNETLFALINPVTSFVMGLGQFFLLYYVGNKVLGGTMTLGEMQQFSSYVSMLYMPLQWLANLPRSLSSTMTSVAKVFDIIDEAPEICDSENAVEKKLDGKIELSHLGFGYDDTPDVLRDVNLTVYPGEMIGIVGRSGAGKSTLINLIMRMYDADEGQILIDGTDIRDIKQESLRRQIGVVLQETLLFSGTLYQNIAYAMPDAAPDRVIAAAKIAGVHKFAVRLPDGYNTVIGEKGYTLSGGERQRVAIARALLHDPKILILDEATSSLDTETEKDIQDALQKLIAGRTTVAIAHRLSTLRNATRLVVLDRGTVAEVGTHDELMRAGGLYYELVMAQRQMSKVSDGNVK